MTDTLRDTLVRQSFHTLFWDILSKEASPWGPLFSWDAFKTRLQPCEIVQARLLVDAFDELFPDTEEYFSLETQIALAARAKSCARKPVFSKQETGYSIGKIISKISGICIYHVFRTTQCICTMGKSNMPKQSFKVHSSLLQRVKSHCNDRHCNVDRQCTERHCNVQRPDLQLSVF